MLIRNGAKPVFRLIIWCALAAPVVSIPAPPSRVEPPNGTSVSVSGPGAGIDFPIVFPDGQGLPVGQGTGVTGALLYRERCARCHGANGEGGSAPELVGGREAIRNGETDRSIGAFWPYATTLFDFIRRAMPLDSPGSLTVDESYALTAYLLHRHGLISEGHVVDQSTLPQIAMPNRNGFTPIDTAAPR